MQKKDSGPTFIFAIFCIGGVLALLSQADLREGAASSGTRGTLDPGTAPYSLDRGVAEDLGRGPRLLEARTDASRPTTCCKKKPLFD